jgi:hypothetical protein
MSAFVYNGAWYTAFLSHPSYLKKDVSKTLVSGYGFEYGIQICSTLIINPFKMKFILSNTKTQCIPRSKHSPPQFKKPIIWWCVS